MMASSFQKAFEKEKRSVYRYHPFSKSAKQACRLDALPLSFPEASWKQDAA